MTLSWQEFQPIVAIAPTPTAYKLLKPFATSSGATIWLSQSCAENIDNLTATTQIYEGSLKQNLPILWKSTRALVFCLASGAVVRLIAPLLEDKSRDPAVVVVDEAGKFVVSLCSGHRGGADRLTRAIALQLDATPIITGASSSLGLPAVDLLGVPFGWSRGSGDWTGVSAAVAKSLPVEVFQEAGLTLWQQHLPPGHPFRLGFPEGKEKFSPKGRIWISFTRRQFSPKSGFPKVQWHPRVLWVGVGCERGTSKKAIASAIESVFQTRHLAEAAVAGIATIDLKADEAGLLEFCREKDLPLRTFTAEELASVEVPTPSDVVAAAVGTPSVAEAAAMLAARESDNNSPTDNPSATSAFNTAANLLVTKQIRRSPTEPGAVTVAVALAETEYTGRTGKLLLVGTGPGTLEQMTPAAQTAVNRADAVVGYSLYIDLIAPLLRPGQIVEAMPITQERQRAQRAIALANWGLSVAVVSSGDCGIYGMAGLVLELLRETGWDGKVPMVEVFPGVSAVQATAARVGAPLMHDFCTVSLSDLLTPWEVIQKRLEAAAMADFVVALYNPRSQKRTEHLVKAREIFLQHRPKETPVAIARSVYREDEQITLTTLEKMLEVPVDMLSAVLIGNKSTAFYEGWMITPRGYLG
jgi:cobalt-precorrin 5A hydrolase/precorrin-3B C17-methyltransferase